MSQFAVILFIVIIIAAITMMVLQQNAHDKEIKELNKRRKK